jgi:hypothetical protein
VILKALGNVAAQVAGTFKIDVAIALAVVCDEARTLEKEWCLLEEGEVEE